MATVIGGNKVKLSNGQVVDAQTGAWYDGQQFWNGTLSNAGQFNAQNNQPGQQGGAAPVQNAADAAYLQTRGDVTAPQRVVTAPAPMAPSYNPGVPGSAMPMMQGMAQPTVDLAAIYKKALEDSGISNYMSQYNDLQGQIDQRKQALADKVAGINDNPWYSEGTRVGRVAKLNSVAEADIGNLISQQQGVGNQISAAKADAQVRLNIAQNQYNIDDAAYQRNLQMFNQLLTSGALGSVSDSDLAQISMVTGLSTSMVKQIAETANKKNNPVQVTVVDDGTNQKAVAIDSNGNVVNSQVLGASRATQGGTGGSASAPGGSGSNFSKAQYSQALSAIKYQDTANNKGDKGDHKLAPWEVQAAIQQIASYLGGDLEQAKELFLLAANSGGYSEWTGK